ncbi:putative mannose-1-phosphate guanylyltransferase/mannose-6-phosphate isomerase [Bacteroidales bacterium KA00344]|nr:putative mannose-1-phosphate guanylyltransferase/mannose-6-phosphate isomerase [Bacteroidales bacterium KA00344]
MANNNHIVIMAGGIGSRFWPMSTPEYPKQFIDVMGMGKSLIQLTTERLSSIAPISNFWVVTSQSYVDIVREQLPDIPEQNILAEPEPRNTAPCIAYACWKIKKKHPAANIVVTPSDALVINTTEYQRVIKEALMFTANSNNIVTIGIRPSRPETGYGYIAAAGQMENSEIHKVAAFKEKPDLETAKKYMAAGNYFWNAGIFVWNVETITHAICKFTPDLAKKMDDMNSCFYTEREPAVLAEVFPTCEKISIDYAVMEKSESIYTIPAEFGWSDLGSWGALQNLLKSDNQGNAHIGPNIHLYDSKGCVVHAQDAKQVVIQGLEDYIVALRDGRLLICSLDNEQMIKEYSQNIK